MKKVQITNHLLLERSKLFARYAENMPSKVDMVELHLDDPYCGLIKMHFKVNGVETLLITASNAYEPFVDIREWLEQIVKHIFDFSPTGVRIYDEFDDYLLYYEPFFFQSNELLTNHPPILDGLFYIYDSCEKKIVSEAVVETKRLVRVFYESIHDFAKESIKSDGLVVDWIQGAYNNEYAKYDDDDPRVKEIFLNKVTSPIVEKFLNDKNGTTKFIPVR
jgi:hypothetical protein